MNFRGVLFGIIACGMLMSIGTSAKRPIDRSNEGLQIGDVLPEMKEKAERPCTLVPQENSRRYTLVHFWAAYDAESRAENKQWDCVFESTVSDKISFRSVCLDPDSEVYTQTVTLDGVAPQWQYHVASAHRLDMMKQYGLSEDFHSYLVDDQGVVRSVDPTPTELKKFYLH